MNRVIAAGGSAFTPEDLTGTLGRAAAQGSLDAHALRSRPPEEALTHLRALPGAELILLRGAGDPGAFPAHEKRLHRAPKADVRTPPSEINPNPGDPHFSRVRDDIRAGRT
ncbi:hypothetical protein ACOZ38_20290 [Sphaerisporangium viridialbum]|uniref:hypothetical protein n=1 Tax=Sphaerisporangium viridialbum TaxID=46189 RepID=UPI003C755CCB